MIKNRKKIYCNNRPVSEFCRRNVEMGLTSYLSWKVTFFPTKSTIAWYPVWDKMIAFNFNSLVLYIIILCTTMVGSFLDELLQWLLCGWTYGFGISLNWCQACGNTCWFIFYMSTSLTFWSWDLRVFYSPFTYLW